MRAALFLLRVVVALVAGALLYADFLWAGPDFEAHFFPVLTHQSTGPVDLLDGGRRACLTRHFDKERDADLVDAGWTIRDGEALFPYQAVRTVADSADMGDGIVQREPGRGQWSRKCIEIPASLVGRSFRLTGFVEYRTAVTGLLWTVRQRLPEAVAP